MIYTELGTRLGTDGFSNIRYDFMPNNEDNIILIKNSSTPQIPEVQGHDTDVTGIQIMVRNTNAQTAMSTARSIYEFLVDFRNDKLVNEGLHVIYTLCDQPVSYVGPDEQNRHLYSVYFSFRHARYVVEGFP